MVLFSGPLFCCSVAPAEAVIYETFLTVQHLDSLYDLVSTLNTHVSFFVKLTFTVVYRDLLNVF